MASKNQLRELINRIREDGGPHLDLYIAYGGYTVVISDGHGGVQGELTSRLTAREAQLWLLGYERAMYDMAKKRRR
jgi:hypothetical protein